MKKLLKRLIITCILILVLYCVLLIPRVDNFLTEKINSLSTVHPAREYIITSPDTNEEYENPPFTYVKEGKLFLLQGAHSINISPENSDSNDFEYDINNSFKYKRNCKITNEYMVYLLEIDGEDTLFKYDFNENNIVRIGTKVDSFDITNQGDIIYSTGYIHSNNIYIYKDGESKEVVKNVKAYRIPNHNCIIFKGNDGKLLLYSESNDKLETIDKDVTDVYNPYTDKHNYLKTTNELKIYYNKKGSGDFLYSNGQTIEIDSFDEEIPETIYETNTNNRFFYYSEKDKTLFLKDSDDKYGLMRDVYKVFSYDKENERFILATSKAVFVSVIGETNRVSSIKLYNLNGLYKRNESMITNHLKVTTNDYTTFYTTKLAGSSFILNIFNSNSWLNSISVYKYRLFECTVKNSIAGSLNELDVTLSHSKSDGFLKYDTNRNLYITKNKSKKGIDVFSFTDGKLDIRRPFEKEKYDTITTYNGKDYIYFVTYTEDADDKYMLYVYVNDIPVLIHKGNFTIFNAYSSIYLVTQTEGTSEHVADLYNISRINSLQVEKVADNVTFGK